LARQRETLDLRSSVFVPMGKGGIGGWRPWAEVTADDLRAIADDHIRLEEAARRETERKVSYYTDLAQRIEAQGVTNLGEVEGELPQLPN
jgi:hypothetical protein